MKKTFIVLVLAVLGFAASAAGPGSDRMWMNYSQQNEKSGLSTVFSQIALAGSDFDPVIRKEFDRYFTETFNIRPEYGKKEAGIRMVWQKRPFLGKEGFEIRCADGKVTVLASEDAGFLYAAYHLIRMIRTGQLKEGVPVVEQPAYALRMLNHWDNLNGRSERGYAGTSLWKWDELPSVISPRYEEYARFNASVGINAVVLNNVNADPRIMTPAYLEKVKVLADIFRKYHIQVFLSANFASPMKPSDTPDKMKNWGGIGHLDTADPLDERVISWWEDKVKEIYSYIPDFGGFLVKASSEGMPGPQDYGRGHAEGANLLARALKPYGGVVMWRAFVYGSKNSDPDRLKNAYNEFVSLDGRFEDNVVLQIKNGPLDFQASEPASPLFGAMSSTHLAAEVQITQEYLGHSTSLVYLHPMWYRFLHFDTYCEGAGSTVAKVLQGRPRERRGGGGASLSAIAGVANTGSDFNWTGHYFAQSNWYAFGRMAWNPDLTSGQIATEWTMQTWNSGPRATAVIREMMMPSWESFMKSHSLFGLGLTMDYAHYKPYFAGRNGKGWKADGKGLGTDRTSEGSGFSGQYHDENRVLFDDIDLCPEEFLLTFHFVNWNRIMPDGREFSYFLMDHLKDGMRQVDRNIRLWSSLEGDVDALRYESVMQRLIQEKEDNRIFYDDAYAFFSRYVEK